MSSQMNQQIEKEKKTAGRTSRRVRGEARITVPTFQVLDGLVREGFSVIGTAETKGRSDKTDAHFLTLAVPGRVRAIGGWVPVIEVINSPKKPAGLQFLMLIRNPSLSADMVVGDADRRSLTSLGVEDKSDVDSIVKAAVGLIDETLPLVKDKLNLMKHINLTAHEQNELAREAMKVRWPTKKRFPVTEKDLLEAAGNDHSMLSVYTSIHNALLSPVEVKKGSRKVHEVRTRSGELLVSRSLWNLTSEVFEKHSKQH